MTSLVGLLSVGRITMASVGTAPVCFVRSFCPFIQPRCWENSLSLIIMMSSPFLKLRSVASSVEERTKQLADSERDHWAVTTWERKKSALWPRLSASFRVTAYCDLSVSPLRNIVMRSAMAPAEPPVRVKSPLSVRRHTTCPDTLLSLGRHQSRIITLSQ